MSRTKAPAHRVTGWTALLIIGGIGVVMMLVAYGAWWLAIQVTGGTLPGNPFIAFGYARYRAAWSTLATVFTVIAETALIGSALWALARRSNRTEVDRLGRGMAAPRELAEVTGRSAAEKAKRLRPGADLSKPGGVGLSLGRTVHGNAEVIQSWEDMAVAFAGPRTGKTAAVAISSVIDAPGPTIVTSNKRDLRDHTRGVREGRGNTVWESDLQGITGEEHQNWWWNPLGDVTSLNRARRLASRFVAAEKIDGAQTNDYFDGGASELLAVYFYAAALGGGDLMHAYAWLSQEDSQVPNKLLKASDPIAATKLRTAQGLYIKQRDGLYDVARRNLNVLTDPAYARTILPPRRTQIPGDDTDLGDWMPTHNLPEFDPAAFVKSSDVLYTLSMEGPDSATALTTALVGRVIDEGVELARRSPGGRLRVPMVAVLDEAANVCKLRELPHWYSHLGSHGIVVQTFFQSPSQAAETWPADQLDQMVSASNIHYYGGGVKDTDYLEDISKAIGPYDVERWATSHSEHGVSHSQSWAHEPLVPVDKLFALPKNRAVVMTTGNAPVLVRKQFWNERPDAEAIRASNAKYGVPDDEDEPVDDESDKELL